MRSLFILSLPRSLSSQVHAMACDALALRSPAWTSAGTFAADSAPLLQRRAGSLYLHLQQVEQRMRTLPLAA